MGRASKELKEIKAKVKNYPVEDVDYYIVRTRKGETTPAGYVHHFASRNYITAPTIIGILEQVKAGAREPSRQPRKCLYSGEWALFVGARPDKRWGIVCP